MPSATMTQLRNLLLPALLLIAAVTLVSCGDPGSPMGGSWNQITGTEAEGMTIDFEKHGNKVSVHLAPREDGGHDHAHGELVYTYDPESHAVTVKAELLGHDKGDTWSGKVDGDKLELGAADTLLKFKRGVSAHGH